MTTLILLSITIQEYSSVLHFFGKYATKMSKVAAIDTIVRIVCIASIDFQNMFLQKQFHYLRF
jgi:hypothetical protein